MSHFTRVKTQLQDLETVRRALVDLGYEVTEGIIRGYAGQVATAPVVVPMEAGFDIGFRQEGKRVQMIADLWGLKVDREQFLAKLTQRYAYITVLDKAAEQGWQLTTDEIQSDGTVRLVMQRWS